MVGVLLRAGANEEIVDDNGKKVIDVIRRDFQGGDWLDEDDKRMRQLLADAPADRAWRRRGYLVLCCAHPDRVQQKNQVICGTHHSGIGRGTRGCAAGAMAGGTAGDSSVDERTSSNDRRGEGVRCTRSRYSR